jgi:4-amino-4-deoxy-L-arabinose transferase-like glycosyltransferase
MAESGDWVTPRLYGKAWFEKPVLYYWGAAAAFKLLGVGEEAARLPSAISALLGTLALGWLVWRLYGGETARWFLALLPITAGMLGFAHAAATDMPFSGMLTVALVAAASVVELRNSSGGTRPSPVPWFGLILFGAFLGAATLAKGPAAVVLAGGSVGLWALVTRRWSQAFRLTHPVAVASFCGVALPWYILCARRNPDFFRVFVLEHNFARFFTPLFRHEQPFWFYLPVILVGALPWTPLVVVFFARLRRTWQTEPSAKLADLYFASWALFPVLFFSASKSKLPGYVLPALPAVALFAARAVVRAVEAGRQRFAGLSLWLTIATPVLLAAASAWFLHHYFPLAAPRSAIAFLSVASAAALCVCGGIALWGRQRLAFFVALVATLVMIEGADVALLPWVDRLLSSRTAARALPPAESWQHACAFQMRSGAEFSLNFYLRRELSECPLAGIPAPGLTGTMPAFVSPSGVQALARQQRAYRIADSSCLNTFLVEILPRDSASGMKDGR